MRNASMHHRQHRQQQEQDRVQQILAGGYLCTHWGENFTSASNVRVLTDVIRHASTARAEQLCSEIIHAGPTTTVGKYAPQIGAKQCAVVRAQDKDHMRMWFDLLNPHDPDEAKIRKHICRTLARTPTTIDTAVDLLHHHPPTEPTSDRTTQWRILLQAVTQGIFEDPTGVCATRFWQLWQQKNTFSWPVATSWMAQAKVLLEHIQSNPTRTVPQKTFRAWMNTAPDLNYRAVFLEKCVCVVLSSPMHSSNRHMLLAQVIKHFTPALCTKIQESISNHLLFSSAPLQNTVQHVLFMLRHANWNTPEYDQVADDLHDELVRDQGLLIPAIFQNTMNTWQETYARRQRARILDNLGASSVGEGNNARIRKI